LSRILEELDPTRIHITLFRWRLLLPERDNLVPVGHQKQRVSVDKGLLSEKDSKFSLLEMYVDELSFA
jgi:hypothetical protein